MRVIAGEFRSRKLKAPEGMTTRPTPDRLRETLFDILQTRLEGCVFVDAYAGSGAVGIEALSRGALRSIFIEKSRAAVEVIRENLHTLKLTARAEVFTGKVAAVLERIEADIVFLDPPYELAREYEESLEVLGTKPPSLVIVQHAARADLPAHYGGLQRYRILKQGDNSLSFYRVEDGGSQ
jgi:16S rRNA (guanine(966)-N(2))-methyltransferase RsmD